MIAVLVETEGQGTSLVSREALTFARRVALDLGDAPVHAVLVGPLEDGLLAGVMDELGAQGVVQVQHADDERLASYSGAAYAAAVVDAVRKVDARMLLAAGTPRGNEVLAHAATRLDVAMAANVVAVDSTDPLVVSRQVVGGSALEEMRLGDRVAVLSVAGHACDPEPAAQPTTPDRVGYTSTVAHADLVTRVARTEAAVVDDSAALTSARVVVGAGRGAGGPDGFKDLLELTELLGGALGVSRVVTSLGWRPHGEQVGQTGSRISPDLYIPCGISGAIQHWAGCQSAKVILAINTDAEAPMVTKAHYAVIGDLHEIVPAINEEIRRRQGR
jgi:electron transfer flavoprotein alpha subunit